MRRLLSFIVLFGGCLLAGCDAGGGPQAAPLQYNTVTADGWALNVQRFKPALLDGRKAPVVLCHGLSYNNLFYDLAPEVSLARYLRDAGYDVWVPSLRGAGWSTKPPISRLRQLFRGDLYTAGGVFSSGGRGALKLNWTVDDHIQYDAPAILDLVAKETGRPQAHWLGHSMGGMVLVGYLSGASVAQPPPAVIPADRIASFIALGVPVYVEPPLSKPLQLIAEGQLVVEMGNAVVSTNLPALLGQLGGTALATPIDVLFFNKDDVDDPVIRRLNAWGTEDISPGQLGQLIAMIKSGRFRSADEKTEYTARLGEMKTPALFMVGTVDNLATVEAVKRLWREWGAGSAAGVANAAGAAGGTASAPVKRYGMFGAVNGQHSDYGHDDLVIGRHAREEVYPVIRQWLDERSGITLLPVLPNLLPKAKS